ncbi:single-stranded DNA-binding family protein [Kurthia sp. 11kri321]|uniref:single-stranded DNA-binding protein n=1 Tax=Kurthia sp. 11kri321 TaxID=1750719 RepID=UPI000745CE08|nr:single-stranded DNA-binding protein [Kurthia sp. 11kri321]AMA64289.1 single-stranded DNA-binding family protein [Kurthia sp. 11kri321]
MNNVSLIGRLTKDPELRYTPSGVAVARFTLAVNRTFSNQQGERQADFINIVTWRKTAENTANFLRKGSLAGIVGHIQTGSYDGQDGKRVFTVEVVAENVQFLEPKSTQSAPNGNGNTNGYQQQQNAPQSNYGGQEAFNQSVKIDEDDLPF